MAKRVNILLIALAVLLAGIVFKITSLSSPSITGYAVSSSSILQSPFFYIVIGVVLLIALSFFVSKKK